MSDKNNWAWIGADSQILSLFDYTDAEGRPLVLPEDGSIATHAETAAACRVRRDKFESESGVRHGDFFVFSTLDDIESDKALEVVASQREAAERMNKA